jgi:ATP phosphoribosyltransferase regulatory subunit
MPGKSSAERRALEEQDARIMGVFESAGFEHIAPDILQPADIFLERSGEDIRARTFVFTDPEGRELCLRPDLTVPACRYHLTHALEPGGEAKYSYCGPAFRFDAQGGHPREFGQAGIEWFGAADRETAEAVVLKLALEALEAAGLVDYRARIGDLGLFRALLDDFDIPARWRRRLAHHFWRPQAFRETLDLFTGESVRLRTSISANVDDIAGMSLADATQWVSATLSGRAMPLIGGRSTEEIAARLLEKAADRSQRPLTRAEAQRIHDYLAVVGAPEAAVGAMRKMNHGRTFDAALDRFTRLTDRMDEQGIATGGLIFAATFGRDLEYYTGFVFQIEALTLDKAIQVAGGGRYDDLLTDIGSPVPVSAVGCAIDTGRLAAAIAESGA